MIDIYGYTLLVFLTEMLTRISFGAPFCSLITKSILNSVSRSLHSFNKSYNLKSLYINAMPTIFFPQQKNGKGKGKLHPITCHESTEGTYTYSSTLYLTFELDGVGIHKRTLISCCIVKGT